MAQAETSWVSSAVLTSSGSFLLLGGRLADIYGRKKVLVLSYFILAVWSFVAGFAQNKCFPSAARLTQISLLRGARIARFVRCWSCPGSARHTRCQLHAWQAEKHGLRCIFCWKSAWGRDWPCSRRNPDFLHLMAMGNVCHRHVCNSDHHRRLSDCSP